MRSTSSASFRIALTHAIVFALAIILIGAIVYFAADAEFRKELDSGLAIETRDLTDAYRGKGLPAMVELIAARDQPSATNGYGYMLFDRTGHRLAGGLLARRPAAGFAVIDFTDPRDGPDRARVLTTDISGGYRLVVARDTNDIEHFDHTILGLFSAAFGLVVFLEIAGAVLLGSYLRSRLERLSTPARVIVGGDFDRRMPVGTRHDEFDELALALNAMLDRIAQLLENLRQVSSDVAHDLRTPLARLRNQLETALNGRRELSAYRAGLKGAIAKSDELLDLFAAILRISEVEGGAVKRTFSRIALTGVVNDLCESYSLAVSDGGRRLRCDSDADLALKGDCELISQALINMLENAQHHTPKGTSITVSARGDAANVYLAVADDGPGVAPEYRDRITRRFTRLDSSRATPGYGLGLNLVLAVAQVHDGRIEIDDNRPGLKVTMVVPRITT